MQISRRTFVKAGAAAMSVAAGLASTRAYGANEKIRLGVIAWPIAAGNSWTPHFTMRMLRSWRWCDVHSAAFG